MSGDVSDRKRLVSVTQGNIDHDHFYISGHHDFFPKEVYGASNRKGGTGRPVKLLIDGRPDPVETDIALNGTNGRPRNFFRKRTWVREFFARHEIRQGDVIAIERLDRFVYRIYPFEAKSVRDGAGIPDHWPAVAKGRPTAIDLFAGCGGFSLGLQQAGFENLLAVEWDAEA